MQSFMSFTETMTRYKHSHNTVTFLNASRLIRRPTDVMQGNQMRDILISAPARYIPAPSQAFQTKSLISF